MLPSASVKSFTCICMGDVKSQKISTTCCECPPDGKKCKVWLSLILIFSYLDVIRALPLSDVEAPKEVDNVKLLYHWQVLLASM